MFNHSYTNKNKRQKNMPKESTPRSHENTDRGEGVIRRLSNSKKVRVGGAALTPFVALGLYAAVSGGQSHSRPRAVAVEASATPSAPPVETQDPLTAKKNKVDEKLTHAYLSGSLTAARNIGQDPHRKGYQLIEVQVKDGQQNPEYQNDPDVKPGFPDQSTPAPHQRILFKDREDNWRPTAQPGPIRYQEGTGVGVTDIPVDLHALKVHGGAAEIALYQGANSGDVFVDQGYQDVASSYLGSVEVSTTHGNQLSVTVHDTHRSSQLEMNPYRAE